MNNIRFSVIIPTRERCITLEHTIRTCLNQDYDNFEIIISDNFSQDTTQKVVERFNSPNIIYKNTGKRLSMSHNWEFALRHVTGNYITFLGDDDGLIPGALRKLANIIKNTGAKAVTWRWASYYWPDAIQQHARDLLITPMTKSLEKRITKDILQKVLKFEIGYEELPFLYKGIISTDIVLKVRNESKGDFFHSMTPDLYSAMALATFIDQYYFSTEPFSINGTSGSSGGASYFNQDVSSNAAKIFLDEENIPFHNRASLCPAIPMILAECFFQAAAILPEMRKYSINDKQLIDAVFDHALTGSLWRFNSSMTGIREFAAKNNMVDYVEKKYQRTRYIDRTKLSVIGMSPGYNIKNKNLIVDCNAFNAKNIYDAALLVGFITRGDSAGMVRSSWLTAGTTTRLVLKSIKRFFERQLLGLNSKR